VAYALVTAKFRSQLRDSKCMRVKNAKSTKFGADSQVEKVSPYSITDRTVPKLIPVLGSQPAGYASHKPSSRLPLLSVRPAVTPAILKRPATTFDEQRHDGCKQFA